MSCFQSLVLCFAVSPISINKVDTFFYEKSFHKIENNFHKTICFLSYHVFCLEQFLGEIWNKFSWKQGNTEIRNWKLKTGNRVNLAKQALFCFTTFLPGVVFEENTKKMFIGLIIHYSLFRFFFFLFRCFPHFCNMWGQIVSWKKFPQNQKKFP